MATFVLIHGGGHGGWCWEPVAARLAQAGHRVHAPTLTGLAERRHLAGPAITLDTHIADGLALLHGEDLSDVILVGHSYGGMVMTGMADRAGDRVRRLVYLDAAIPADGEALVDLSPGLQTFNDVRMVDGTALGLWPDAALLGQLYGIGDADLAAWVLPRLTPHPWRTFETALHLQDPARLARIPRAIVNCAATLARRPADKRDRWLAGDFVRTVDAGHDLMLTEPALVTSLLLEIAAL